MGGARAVGWVAAGLVLGAGACYCIYKLMRGQRQGGRGLRLRPSRSAEDLTNGSYDDVLNADQLQKLLYLLESIDDPVITERALVTLGNNAAFSANQVIIRELGGIPIIGSKINNPNHSIKEKALNALNNLSVNVDNQVKIKAYICQVCKDVLSGPLDSAVQLAGLRLLTNMTVTNDHQHMLSKYITDLFHVLLTGNGSTKAISKTHAPIDISLSSGTSCFTKTSGGTRSSEPGESGLGAIWICLRHGSSFETACEFV
ncbi:armadillo repeat-containing protein 10 isoform X2 [Zalophus californianus]|uniref:Armadillo repeat-containing protein 10 isoform X2 n=1 Tax=Zalophus californianus TaxID=9704 RepID=A0A6J2BBW7_ZALCA|nr:armadillo repeat-containing protein 10 isoform X2 [Zalophus californianus]